VSLFQLFPADCRCSLFTFVPDISAAITAASDFINLMDSKPSIDAESNEGKKPKDVQGEIVLRDIHFRYPTRPQVNVLRGLDLVAKPGTFTALVGASGCGKSTIIQLIERFYDPLSGEVLLDGQNIREFSIQEYRKHIALVSQEPVSNSSLFFSKYLIDLFPDTVCWNHPFQHFTGSNETAGRGHTGRDRDGLS
jgi:ABC-type multidrug transport system fused ATPase/permease subunit